MDNAKKLDRQLDNLVLGGLKLHVNLPKHGRKQNPTETINKKHKEKEEIAIEKVEERDKGLALQQICKTSNLLKIRLF